MPLIADRAICVRTYDFSETSQIVALLTREHGMVRMIARGSKRTTKAGASRFDGGVDLLDEGDALFTDRLDKDLNTLAEWKLIDGHRGLRLAQRPLYLGLYLAEIVGNVFESHDVHPGVFDRFADALRQLATFALEEQALALVLDLLAEAGFMPALAECVGCGRPTMGERALYFSPSRGGVACRRCEAGLPDRAPIDPRLIGIATTLMRLPRDESGAALQLPRLTRQQADPLHAMLARHLQHNVDRPFRMVRHIVGKRRAVTNRVIPIIERPTPTLASVL